MSQTTPERRVYMPLRRTAGGYVPGARGVDAGKGLAAKVVLIGVLPMFAQVFHYLNEYPVPYAFSKAWPFLTLPLALYGMARLELPLRSIFLLVLAYALSFTPFMSIVELGNGFFDALTTTIKAWPISYYFSLSVVLTLLAVPRESVRRIVLGYGLATYVVMVTMFLLAPKSWYSVSAAGGKLLMYELERGYRVFMPMFFGWIFLFWLTRTAVMRRSMLHGIGALSLFLPLFLVYKQRTAIAAGLAVTLFGLVTSLPKQLRRLAYGGALVVAAVGLFYIERKMGLISPVDSNALEESLGGSLTVRQNSLRQAFGFLGNDPMRWAFGVGATTRFSTVTLNDIFGNHQFFIADLGWVGVIFEYGVVGAGLLATLYISSIIYLQRRAWKNGGDPFELALADLPLYVLLSSAVYSVVFTPGETASVMALAVFMDRTRQAIATPMPPPPPPPEVRRAVVRNARGKFHVTLGRASVHKRS